MFLHDFSAGGPNKIQDRWSSVRYQVSRAPREGGSVYTIVPVDDPTKVKHVYRNMLKAVVGLSLLCLFSQLTCGRATLLWMSIDLNMTCWFLDNHLLCTLLLCPLPDQPQSPQVPVPSDPGFPAGTSSITPYAGASTSLEVPPVSCPGPSHEAPRRTMRSTAGHHSNVRSSTANGRGGAC